MLVVEVVFAEELVAAVLKAAFSPVLRPKGDGGFGGADGLGGGFAGSGDLVEIFPTRGGEGGGKVLDAETLGLACRGKEAKAEAELAAAAAFGLLLKATDGVDPLPVVVVGVYPAYAKAFGMAFALVLARFVFLQWVDVGVIIIYGGAHAILQQPFDYGRRARGAAGVEQHFAAAVGNGYCRLVGFLRVMTIFHFDDYFGAKIL